MLTHREGQLHSTKPLSPIRLALLESKVYGGGMKRSITNAQARKLGWLFSLVAVGLSVADALPMFEANSAIVIGLLSSSAVFFGLPTVRNIAELSNGYEGY